MIHPGANQSNRRVAKAPGSKTFHAAESRLLWEQKHAWSRGNYVRLAHSRSALESPRAKRAKQRRKRSAAEAPHRISARATPPPGARARKFPHESLANHIR